MLAQVTLSSSESKRIIAKAVVEHSAVKKAIKEGIVVVGLGSTNAYIVEEILGEKIDKELYLAGYVDEKGSCVLHSDLRLKEVVLDRGKISDDRTMDIIYKMQPGDIFIKGANALDSQGNAGVMLASSVGGTIGKIYGIAKSRGIDIILPVGLEKYVPWNIPELSKKTGMGRVKLSTGVPVGLFPVAGEVITEIEAFEILFRVKAYPIAGGSLGSSHAITFLIEGEENSVNEAFDFVKKIKGEPPLRLPPRNCTACKFKICPSNRNPE